MDCPHCNQNKGHTMKLPCLLIPAVMLLLPLSAPAQPVNLPNPSFEEGAAGTPDGWTLSGGEGGTAETRPRNGSKYLWVKGDGAKESGSQWISSPVALPPGTVHVLHFFARRDTVEPGGCAMTGTTLFNVDLDNLPEKWQAFRHVFVTPSSGGEQQLRFGQWESKSRIGFDAVRLVRAVPVHRRFGAVELGAGERIIGNRYNFAPPMAERNTNHFRPLREITCNFNSTRCMFGNSSHLVFEHAIAEHPIKSARLYLWTKHYGAGTFTVEASKDGGGWTPLGAAAEGEKIAVVLPDTLFPADSLRVRLSASVEGGGNVTMHGYRLEAELEGAPMDAAGDTFYFELDRVEPGVEPVITCPALFDPSRTKEGLTLNLIKDGKPLKGNVRLLDKGKEFSSGKLGQPLACPGNAGKHDLTLESKEASLSMLLNVPEYFNNSYGELLDASGVWWASSGWKIPKNRELPKTKGNALRIELAKNEAEAAQLVVRPDREITGFQIATEGLKTEDGAILPPARVEFLRVGYVPVTLPTDNTGVAAPWPDPLPPLSAPLTLVAGENQSFWVRVKTGPDTAPGLYKGTLNLAGDGYSKSVPFEVRVFNFSLPDRMTCTSAFGFGVDRPWQYHGVKSEEDKRRVLDLYLKALTDHHITPYNAVPLDPFVVVWPEVKPGDTPDPAALKVQIDWSRWDSAMQRAYDEYHINSFSIPMQGMGGGTFYSRTEPSLLGFKEDSPVYQALFREYCVAVETHLREKGWLNDGYVYWFDEPDPKDYAFVMNGFNRIKTAAPGIPRMLTEEIQPELIGGPNIWCPLSPAVKPEETRERQKQGDKIWWYVCTGPKAPYATLFIDHPGTELRVWLWQSWQRGVEGILIWETVYWSSPLANPEPGPLQNPYEDPMGWESGYGGEPGTHRPWGNGDGRFLYPPEPAAAGNPAAPVFDTPVDCIRIEMLRDGIEDYEYMTMLRKALAEKGAALDETQRASLGELLNVPPDISESMTEFTKDPAPIEAHRRKVAEALEVLGGK